MNKYFLTNKKKHNVIWYSYLLHLHIINPFYLGFNFDKTINHYSFQQKLRKHLFNKYETKHIRYLMG